MRGPLRAVLRPIVGVWALSLSRSTQALPRPEGSGHVYTDGPESCRLLLFGSGPAVSWGVLRHELGLAGAVARELARLTGRGVEIFITADSDMTLPQAVDRVVGLDLARYDAVILTVGVNDAVALVSLRLWRQQLTTLLSELLAELPPDSRIFMTAVPSILSLGVFRGVLAVVVGQHARAMNAVTAEVCATHPRVEYVELPLLPRERERHRSTRGYAVWAAGMAATMAPRLPAGTRTVSGLDEHGGARLHAASVGSDGERLEGLLRAAAGIAGTRFAAFSVAAGDRVHGIAVVGASRFETSHRGSFTEATVLSRDGIRIRDASTDDRFAHGTLVTGEPHLRFIAAYPVHSTEGSRIGALCVFDPEPDEGSRFEIAHLRDFAKRLQFELRGLEPYGDPSAA